MLRKQGKRMGRPTIITNGRFSVSIEVSQRRIQNTDFSGIEELQPGIPDDAVVWKTQSGRTVKKNPVTNRWVYADLPNKTKNSKKDHDAIEKEINDFLTKTVEHLIEEITREDNTNKPDISGETRSKKSHGKYTLNVEEAQAFHDYLKKQPTNEKHYVDEKTVDGVIDRLRGAGNFSNNLKKIASKGSMPLKGINIEDRARRVISFYLSTGGKCAVTGERMSFTDLQLDHKVPITLGGADAENNWAMMKPKFNQFKKNLMGDKLFAKLIKEINLPAHLREIRQLKQESLNSVRNTWANFLKESDPDIIARSLHENQVKGLVKGAKGTEVLKALLNRFDISYYTPTNDGVRDRGTILPKHKMVGLLLQRIEKVKENDKTINAAISPALTLPDTSIDNDYDARIKKIRAEQRLKTRNQKQTKVQ